MSLSLMKYKDYIWPRDPKDITVSVENDVKDIEIPKNGSVFQSYGRKKRVVSGTGEFLGADCFNQFKELFNLFKNTSDSGFLVIPKLDPFLAIFKNLKLVGDPSPNLVTYSFLFWEDITNIYSKESNIKFFYHIASQEETLWNISVKYRINIETLLQLNQFIKDPNEVLSEGVRITLC